MRDVPGDDFRAFAGAEHMFFGLKDPFGTIRQETEAELRRQVADTVLERIETFGEPKFLTLGKKTQNPSKVVVAHFAFSVLARLYVTSAAGTHREVLDAALTFMFGNVDVPASTTSQTHFDLHGDAQRNFTDDRFKERFLAFRTALLQPDAG
jgi:hypothetical protein